MTAEELIKALEELDPETPVLVVFEGEEAFREPYVVDEFRDGALRVYLRL